MVSARAASAASGRILRPAQGLRLGLAAGGRAEELRRGGAEVHLAPCEDRADLVQQLVALEVGEVQLRQLEPVGVLGLRPGRPDELAAAAFAVIGRGHRVRDHGREEGDHEKEEGHGEVPVHHLAGEGGLPHGPGVVLGRERLLRMDDDHDHHERDDAHQEADRVIDHEVLEVPPGPLRRARVREVDGALQHTPALVRGPGQDSPSHVDHDDLQDPAPDDQLEDAGHTGSGDLAGVLLVLRRDGDAGQVLPETQDRPEDAKREKLAALEAEDVVDELVLISQVDDKKNEREEYRVHPTDGQEASDGED
mmetsp:Transcript_111713/g.315960  ORF Transcript_111713/g.315960 Transcript_111713/m.315960 type:complete len:308 (+) Transcript_111713:175-1098(+)